MRGDDAYALVGHDANNVGHRRGAVGVPDRGEWLAAQFTAEQRAKLGAGDPEPGLLAGVAGQYVAVAENAANVRGIDIGALRRAAFAATLGPISMELLGERMFQSRLERCSVSRRRLESRQDRPRRLRRTGGVHGASRASARRCGNANGHPLGIMRRRDRHHAITRFARPRRCARRLRLAGKCRRAYCCAPFLPVTGRS